MANLRERISLDVAGRDWLNAMATVHHYMHRPVHQRAVPFGWAVRFDGELCQPDGKPSGFIVFASIHYTRRRFAWRRKFLVGAAAGCSVPDSRGGSGRYL